MDIVNRIVDEVAARKDTSPLALPPLYASVDPEALEEIVSSSNDAVTIEFEYCDCTVRVGTDTGIQVREVEFA